MRAVPRYLTSLQIVGYPIEYLKDQTTSFYLKRTSIKDVTKNGLGKDSKLLNNISKINYQKPTKTTKKSD